MPWNVPLTRMDESAAIGLSAKIVAAVEAAQRDFGPEAIHVDVVAAARELVRGATELETVKEQQFKKKQEVNTAADRCVGSIYRALGETIDCFDQKVIDLTAEEQGQLDAARTLRPLLFPDGIGFLRGGWVAQYGATQALLGRSRGEAVRPLLATAGLTHHFTFLERLHVAFGRRMGITSVTTLVSALETWHELLEAYLSTVAARYRRHSPIRDALTAAYEQMSKAINDAKRAESEPEPAAPAAPPPVPETPEE
jgi:hypothetical protein